MKTVTWIVTLLLAATAQSVAAQAYPTKPVRIITASTGTTGDLLTRHLAQRLTDRWGRQVVVENRAGAGAVIAAESAAKAIPDGYTLHMGQLASFAAAVSLHKKLAYDPVRDFAPITSFAQAPLLIVAHASVPAANLNELIVYAKKRPGLLYSSAGNGTGSHLTTALLINVAGLQLVHVPYKGTGAAMVALLAGEVQVSSLVVPSALPQVRAGKMKACAITSRNRFAGAPEIPTAIEAGLTGFESAAWFGMFAPALTPGILIGRLNRDIVEILGTPETQAWIVTQGAQPMSGTPEEFAAFVSSEVVKWRKVIKAAGIRAE